MVNEESQLQETRGGKYLTFRLGAEEYGISILKVKEIIGMMTITPVPRAPDYLKGVLNLRGQVIPVIDLRVCFAMSPADYTERTCIIVVDMNSGSDELRVGIIVDSVCEVSDLKADDIEPAPSLGGNNSYIVGMAKSGQRVKILLDVEKIISREEVELLKQVA